MIVASLKRIAEAVGGELHGPDSTVEGVCIDSREVQSNNLFVALPGERVDGHDYVGAAAGAGAGGALVSGLQTAQVGQIVVPDVQAALGRLARWWREQCGATVFGITGSNGKTTVKTMLGLIVQRAGKAHQTAGNQNNEIGTPLSLLSMPSDCDYAVIEMGAGQPGDIEYLMQLAQPQISVITNASGAHLERMGSIQKVAETKAAVYSGLSDQGIAVINADDEFAGYWEEIAAPRRVITFGLENPSDVAGAWSGTERGGTLTITHDAQELLVKLQVPGRHNGSNALAAASLALAAGIPAEPIVSGLEAFEGVPGRLVERRMPGGWILFEDTYNANPASVRAGIEALMAFPGNKWLILGDMAELGPDSDALHFEVGSFAKRHGIERLFAVGASASHLVAGFGAEGQAFADQSSLTAQFLESVHENVVCLVKGSRSSHMEDVAAALAEQGAR